MSKIKTIGIPILTLLLGIGIGSTNIGINGITIPFSDNNKDIKPKDIEKLNQLTKYIDNNYLGTKGNLAEGMYKGVFKALNDPYSVYMDKKEFAKFNEMTSGKFVGIGVIVSPNDDNRIQVVTPIKGGPAEKAGVRAGDIIWKIENKEYTAEEMDEAISIMKGEEGKKVKLTFLRKENDEKKIIEKEIKREEIISPSVEGEMLENNIGYIRIEQFEDETFNEFKTKLEELKSKNMKSLILDIRENGGGSLSVASEIIDELIPKGIIVYTKDKNGKKEYIYSEPNEINIPLAVLVNENTASASEILTAAVQDTKKGTIIGTKTFGKGVVQIVESLRDGSGIKLTVSEYFSPKGRKINGKGINPDIKIELNEGVERIGPEYLSEDNQLQKAIEVIKSK